MTRNSSLSDRDQMDTAYQEHSELLHMEARGPGDIEAAMHRLQAKYGLDYWKQWQVRYRRSAGAEFIGRMRQAKLDMYARSVRRNIEYLKNEEQKGAGDADLQSLLAEATNLLDKIAKVKARVS